MMKNSLDASSKFLGDTELMDSNLVKRSHALQGFFVGALIPFVLGSILLIQFWNSLEPQEPGLGYCGMGGLPGFLLIVCGTPAGALVGLGVGFCVKR